MRDLPFTLEYSPKPSLARRRSFRRTFAVILVAIAVAGVWQWGPRLFRRAELLYWQRQCLRYAEPADAVVYDQEPPGAAAAPLGGAISTVAVKSTKGGHPFNAQAVIPSCATHLFARLSPPSVAEPVLFMHERRLPSGKPYLVIVTADFFADSTPLFICGHDTQAQILQPGTWKTDPVPKTGGYDLDILMDLLPSPGRLRIYAGQADPVDLSHFTIRYEWNGREGVVDGWIRDQGVGYVPVELRERR